MSEQKYQVGEEVRLIGGIREGKTGVILGYDGSAVPYEVKLSGGEIRWKYEKNIQGFREACKIHETKPVFHDKEEKWICPFCYGFEDED